MKANKFCQVGFMDMVEVGNDIWFCNMYSSTLLRMSTETGRIHIEAILPYAPVNGAMQYAGILYHGGKMVIAPWNASDILIYDLEDKVFQRIVLKNWNEGKRINSLFSGMICRENYVYFFPGKYPAIVKMDLDTYALEYYTQWYESALHTIGETGSVLINEPPICVGEKCVLPLHKKNALMQINLLNGEYRIYSISDAERIITEFQYDEGDFLISYADNSDIYQVKLSEQEGASEHKFELLNNNRCGYCCLACHEDDIIAVPIHGGDILRYSKVGGITSQFSNRTFAMQAGEGREELVLLGHNFHCKKITDSGKMVLFSSYEGKIFIINICNGQIKDYIAEIKPEEAKVIKDNYILQCKMIYEKEELKLNDFINAVSADVV